MDTCPIHAAKLYLQGAGPWKLDEIGIAEDDYLVQCFARYRAAVIGECLAAVNAVEALQLARASFKMEAADAIRALLPQ